MARAVAGTRRRSDIGTGTLIIRNAEGFDLALHPVARAEPPPGFLHFGFRARRAR